jgi:DNA-binding MarR family transcriptional regulator
MAKVAPQRTLDTSFLETLVGYNARRASLHIVSTFYERLAVFGLSPVNFSVLSIIAHNAGVTSKQLCAALNLQPPNLVGIIAEFEKRDLIVRSVDANDRRAIGLRLSKNGKTLAKEVHALVAGMELEVGDRLTAPERALLISLLQKVYR